MNRRGELERAISNARIGVAEYAVFSQLLRRANNTTGEVPNRPVDKKTGEVVPAEKYAPRLKTIFSQAHVSRATGYRALAHLEKHGWYHRRFSDSNMNDRTKFYARLNAGESCDCREIAPLCKRCGKPLAHLRSDAEVCSDACWQALYRQRKRAQKSSQPVSIAPTPSLNSSYGVGAISPTPSLKSPDKPQVSGPQTRNADLENRTKENAVVEKGVGWRWQQWDADHKAGMWD